jgi:hypothetical protein
VFAAALFSASAALAAPVIGTGDGVLGADESNWVLDTGDAFIVNPASPFWVDPASSGVTAQWISPYIGAGLDPPAFTCEEFCPANDPNANTSNAEYTYTLAFDDPGESLYIKWASDNGAEFLLNGSVLAQAGTGGFGSLVAFSILSTAFNAGVVNTFTVIVTNLAQNNGGNPTGLLVNIQTPLPPALLLFVSGLAGLGWLSRRRGTRKGRRAVRAGRAVGAGSGYA